MALPTIEGIAEMMKTFAKGMNLPSKLPKEILNKAINLNSEIPLPNDWERCLNIQRGEFYYINKITGERMNREPWSPRSSHYSNSSLEEYSDESNNNGSSNDHSPTSTITNLSPKEELKTEPKYLILVGCTDCMKYMMVAKATTACPKCGGELMFFDRVD